MGQHEVEQNFNQQELQAFMSAVLDDLRALDYMIDHDLIESGTNRIGAEQEMFLVDRDLRPAPLAMEVLAGISDSLSGRARQVCRCLQYRSGDHRAGAGRGRQLADSVWQTALARDETRALSAFRGRALAHSTRAQHADARWIRRALAENFRARIAARSSHAVSPNHDHLAE